MGDVDLSTTAGLLALLLSIPFLAYVALLVTSFLRPGEEPPGDPAELEWHVLMPCLDEEVVVGRTVARFLADFPHARLWCIDDASDDGTLAVLEGLAARHDHLHVVRRVRPEAREGKGPALNAAWQLVSDDVAARGVDPAAVVVGVLDADGRLAPSYEQVLAGPGFFGDPEIDAVQIVVRIENRTNGTRPASTSRLGRWLLEMQDLEFTAPIAAMQLLRRRTRTVALGGNGQFTRLSALDAIAAWAGTPWHGALLEDFELGVHLLLSGRGTAYCNSTWVEQEGLTSLRRLTRQRSRWTQGTFQCIRYLPLVLGSRRIANRGALELCYFFAVPWLQIAASFIYLVSYAYLIRDLVVIGFDGAAWSATGLWAIVPLWIVLGLGPFFIWGPLYRRRVDPTLTRRRAVLLGATVWPYCMVFYVSCWWAMLRLITDREDWKKTVREDALAEVRATAPAPVRHTR